VLNLFAYTGGASLAAKRAGADVVHVDSVKQVVSWARENMEASGLDNIRWIVDDALKFVKREVKRGNKYQGLILDPPAYGRGPDGEKWLLEENINELLKLCSQLLDKEQHFFILNLYSLGFSALIVDNLIEGNFGRMQHPEYGELYLADQFNKRLPLGVFYRFSSH
jgi:23S rRNA (cytosine1962-C5)-methyltransferase